MSKFKLPALLSSVIDDVATGALLKNVNDDLHRVLVVDFNDGGQAIVAQVKKKIRKAEKVPISPADFEFTVIKDTDTDNWIVLEWGHDQLLVE